jgi:4-hydroxybenzoate polyprenyltransferase
MSIAKYLQAMVQFLLYHANTLILFTGDQVFDTVIPGTAFSTFAVLAGPTLGLPEQNLLGVMQRLPIVWSWLWLMILQFCLQNQRHTASIEEDAINKPWRPIPSGRISQGRTLCLLAFTCVLSGIISYNLDVLPIYLAWTALGSAYNDFGGGDHSGMSRNVFCGALFSCTFGGALSIALGPHPVSYPAWKWTALVTFGIIACTIHAQDFRDETGDKARGRHTLVIEMGRKPALWTVIVAVSFWSIYIPMVFFVSGWVTVFLSLAVGGYLSAACFQSMRGHDTGLDRHMYKIWCLWIGVCCGLPTLAYALP